MLRRLVVSPRVSNGLRSSLRSLQIFSFSSSSSSSTAPPIRNTTATSPLEDDLDHSDVRNEALQSSAKISIDRSGLFNPPEHSHKPSSGSELVKHLKGIIKFRGGPISVAEYMEEVLTNPKAGFYMNRDVFGSEGDFITSPEVSQMFGEMIGVWSVCLWEQMGQPSRVNLIELGPGRGTLMADLLRGTSKFENFMKSLHIHMVECSPTMQNLQYRTLKCTEEDTTGCDGAKRIVSMFSGVPISWHAMLEQVPFGLPTIVIGHEFYDALPIHQFQSRQVQSIIRGGKMQRTSRGWCEKMVDLTDDSQLRFVLSPHPTPANLYLMKRFKWATKEEIAKLESVEVCPKGMDLTNAIAKRIGSDGGGALIIDYGLNGVVANSLQAIRKHKFVDILDNPGTADLSAYVDFASIRHSAIEASEDVSVYGPVSQSQFLGSLGINFRAEALLANCTDEQAESLRTGYWRLVGDGEAPFWEGPDDEVPIGMGTRYLAMTIVNKKQGTPVPFQ